MQKPLISRYLFFFLLRRFSRMDQPSNKFDISSLPSKVMVNIFEFLTLKQRLTASLTCKKWYQLAFSPEFCRNMRITMYAFRVSDENIGTYQNYRNAYIRMNCIDLEQSAMGYFFRAAPLESLWIHGRIDEINTLLDDNLPLMNELTALRVDLDERVLVGTDVLMISHPTLKSIKIDEHSRLPRFDKIDCPNLTDLSITTCGTEWQGAAALQLVIQCQKQLQSLEVMLHGNDQLLMLKNTNLNNLKKLHLFIDRCRYDVELSFDRMVNLVELKLEGDYHHVTVGEELGVLKHLSKLSLASIDVDTEGLEKASRKMEKLHDLILDRCGYLLPTIQPWHIESENIRNLTIYRKEYCLVMLPRCKKLKSLTLITHTEAVDYIFVQACISYPQLEKLHFSPTLSSCHPLDWSWPEFRSSTSFPYIQKLKLLKSLKISRMFLKKVNWASCSSMKIENLELNYCQIPRQDFRQMIDSVGPRLRRLFLDHCNGATNMFVIDDKFVELMRKDLRWCRISCDIFKRKDDTVQPETADIAIGGDIDLEEMLSNLKDFKIIL